MNTQLEALKNTGTPEQKKRFKRIDTIYKAVKDLGYGSLRAGIIQQYAKSWKLATVTVNKYARYGEQMAEEALEREQQNDGSMGMMGKVVIEEALEPDFEYEPSTPPEGLSTAEEYIKSIGGVSVDNFGHADPTWPWEGLSGASIQIEQMERDVVIHMTVTISQEEMVDTILGLMTKSNIGFTSKLIG